MTRLLVALAGLLALGAAAVLAPGPARTPTDPLSALGRSLGGLRVGLVDVLFLRAERLRKEGRVEEIPDLVDAIRRLEPGNVAAVDFLISLYAYDLFAEAPDAAARAGWWEEAWDLVEDALREHPSEDVLWLRSTDLLLELPSRDPGILPAVHARVADPDREGIERLAGLARRTEVLPRRGRIHLLRLAILLPLVAAARLDDAAQVAALLAMGEEVLALRSGVLSAMSVPALEGSADRAAGIPLSLLLAQGIRVVREVRRALDASDLPGARAALGEYAARVPGTELESVLAARLDAGVPRDG